jgi:hypothetical protein
MAYTVKRIDCVNDRVSVCVFVSGFSVQWSSAKSMPVICIILMNALSSPLLTELSL